MSDRKSLLVESTPSSGFHGVHIGSRICGGAHWLSARLDLSTHQRLNPRPNTVDRFVESPITPGPRGQIAYRQRLVSARDREASRSGVVFRPRPKDARGPGVSCDDAGGPKANIAAFAEARRRGVSAHEGRSPRRCVAICGACRGRPANLRTSSRAARIDIVATRTRSRSGNRNNRRPETRVWKRRCVRRVGSRVDAAWESRTRQRIIPAFSRARALFRAFSLQPCVQRA